MSFLQPALLYGLPLIALPIIIHLIHRQQHKTVQWAAMLFLLDAKRMTKGMAKLRQWLILLMRTLLVAGLIVMLGRPIAGLWLGNLAGSSTDTTMILLDRSVSMEQKSAGTQLSKRQTALLKLTELLQDLEQSTNLLLFDSAQNLSTEVQSPQALSSVVNAEPTSTAADIPQLLEAALDHIEINQTGQTDLWICSDLQRSNWHPGSPRWESIRARISSQKALRIYLLNYPDPPSDDFSITATSAKLHPTNGKAQLLLDASIRRNTNSKESLTLPIQIIVQDQRIVHNVEIESNQYSLQAHPIPVPKTLKAGWGRIEIPADDNPSNNLSNFLIAEPPIQKTITVSDSPNFNQLIKIAASSPLDPYLNYNVEQISTREASRIEWDTVALLCWHAPLPTGIQAQQLINYVENGGSILFFPPDTPDPDTTLFGMSWSQWDDGPDSLDPIRTWRTDSGILRNTLDGKALPVGKLKIYRNCQFEGDATAVATLDSGTPLLSHALTSGGNAWFCGTLPQSTHSSLSQDGIVFYILLHRAISEGARHLGNARRHSAGDPQLALDHNWNALDEFAHPPSERHLHIGVYQQEDQWIALNRPATEDSPEILTNDMLASLMEGLPYQVVEDEAGSDQSITSEIWRLFVYLMAAAALLEALLCIPKLQKPATETPVFPAS